MSKLQSISGTTGKETIYVDVDDEITSIIDKVQNAKGKVIALVLPKRATVLQSIVNMKLLKRTADSANKNLVLITSEAGLMPLAGSVGLHVADTPTSKPSIPPAPVGPSDEPESIDEPLDIVDGTAADEEFDASSAGSKPVGELAAAGAAGKIAEDDIDENIELGDDSAAAAPAAAATPKPKKNKKLAVPNFDSFRKKLLLGGLALVVLIVAWIFAFMVMPHATIAIRTDTQKVPTNLDLVLSTTAQHINSDTDSTIVPATAASEQKTDTQTVPATGQQNNGQKAAGTVTMSMCVSSFNPPASVPAGTSVSQGGLTYITQETTDFTLAGPPNGQCLPYKSTNATDIVALKGGANYNVDSATFSVSGRSEISASGSASGGTDDIVKVVSQSDIDNATSKMKAQDNNSVKQQLVSDLEGKGVQAVQVTFLAGDPKVTTDAQAGDKADNVTVTAVTAYTMLGVHKSDLQQLVVKNVNQHIDKSKQSILDDGIANAKFTEQDPATATGATVNMQVKSTAGPRLNAASLKQQVVGKKSGDIKQLIKQTPGVTNVDVHYSPFWVSSTPKSTGKITIQIDKAKQ